MKLTTRGRYAFQALIDLITNSNGKAVKLLDISTRQNLPIAYLEQLFRQLRIGGVVKSVRGPGGGYVLARAPEEISIQDVLKAVKELTSYSDVVKLSEDATRDAICAHKVITRLDEAAMKVLSQPLSSLL
jgi:Rrf2 family iron-sulfur cluster assembly transcriptional regulator